MHTQSDFRRELDNQRGNLSQESSYTVQGFQPSMGTHSQTRNWTKPSERTMQELRLLAYEYVKQIVVKANELSQSKAVFLSSHDIALSPPACGPKSRDKASHDVIVIDPVSSRLVQEAAAQINEQFRSSNNRSNREQYKNKSVTYLDSRQIVLQGSKSPHEIVSSTSKSSTATVSMQNPPPAKDYVEQDYATMSSSQDENDSRTGIESARSGTRGTNRTRSKFKGLHQRLSWHLLVSCFSDCLPEAMTKNAAESRGGRSEASAV